MAATEQDPVSQASSSPRRSCLGRTLMLAAWGGAATLLVAAAAAFLTYLVYDHVTRKGVPGPPIRVVIPEGSTGKTIGSLLEREGLVDSEYFFRLAVRLDKTRRPVKAGAYTIPSGLSPTEILHVLQEGPNAQIAPGEIPPDRKVTIPEGLTVEQASKLFKNPDAFLAAAKDPALIASLGVKADSLIGFLMPNTYYFDKPPTEHEVVERMVAQFRKTYDQLVTEFPDAAARDMYEVVTVASLVEEEGKVAEERPLIAAVIYNRVAKKMPLGIDATLQYALGKYGQRMLDSDKETDSPYNTYKNAGLPPGPISNPGVASLRAALAPADVKYLYFVSNADGKTHTFSDTLAEHTRAVARFRKEIAVQRRQLKERISNAHPSD